MFKHIILLLLIKTVYCFYNNECIKHCLKEDKQYHGGLLFNETCICYEIKDNKDINCSGLVNFSYVTNDLKYCVKLYSGINRMIYNFLETKGLIPKKFKILNWCSVYVMCPPHTRDLIYEEKI